MSGGARDPANDTIAAAGAAAETPAAAIASPCTNACKIGRAHV